MVFLSRQVKVGTTLWWNVIQQAGTCGKHFHHSSQKSTGTPLCISRVGLVEKERKRFSGAYQGAKLHQWRHLAWRCSSNRMWMISMKLEKNWEGEYFSKAVWWRCLIAARGKWSSSLFVSQSVIQLFPACLLMLWSSCVHRYANSWPV